MRWGQGEARDGHPEAAAQMPAWLREMVACSPSAPSVTDRPLNLSPPPRASFGTGLAIPQGQGGIFSEGVWPA